MLLIFMAKIMVDNMLKKDAKPGISGEVFKGKYCNKKINRKSGRINSASVKGQALSINEIS